MVLARLPAIHFSICTTKCSWFNVSEVLWTGPWQLSGDGKLYFSAAGESGINNFHTSHKALGWIIGSWGGKKGGGTWETIMYLGRRLCLPRVLFPHSVNHTEETFTYTKYKDSNTHASTHTPSTKSTLLAPAFGTQCVLQRIYTGNFLSLATHFLDHRIILDTSSYKNYPSPCTVR